MPIDSQHFVLFQSGGMVKAMIIPSVPNSFIFEGRTFSRAESALIEFSHLIRETVLVGFEFLSPEDAGEKFLSSRFICDSQNVSLTYWAPTQPVLEIYLGDKTGAESDQGSALGISTFVTAEQDYILGLPRMTWAQFELGFDLVTDGGPSPITTAGVG